MEVRKRQKYIKEFSSFRLFAVSRLNSAYDANGSLLWKRDGKNAVTIYKYDELNRLTNVYYNYTGSLNPITYPGGNGDVKYTYFAGGQIKNTVIDSTGTTTYAIDKADRVTSYTQGYPASKAVAYTYNPIGQVAKVTRNTFITNYNYFANGWLV